MDKTVDSGSTDTGSIPVRDARKAAVFKNYLIFLKTAAFFNYAILSLFK